MCGIVGTASKHKNSVLITLEALQALQHRGQESAGLGADFDNAIKLERRMGEVTQGFHGFDPAEMPSHTCIGQNRYSTIGDSELHNAQPIGGYYKHKPFALVHNGNLINMRKLAEQTGCDILHLSDTHAIARLLAQSSAHTLEEALENMLNDLEGSYCLIILYDGRIIAYRDHFGFHPLQLGRIDEHVLLVASESAAFDFVGGSLIRDILPGEMVVLENGEVVQSKQLKKPELKFDIFEFFYYLTVPSIIHGVEVGTARYYLGKELARTYMNYIDIRPGSVIVPVADSGNQAALGFYEELAAAGHTVKFRPYALFRSHSSNIKRSFIEPTEERRMAKLRHKFNPRPAEIAGEHVIVVDDSIVRGATAKFIVKKLQNVGARTICCGIASPPAQYPCIYGVDTYKTYLAGRLIGRNHKGNSRAIADEIGLGELCYLPLQQAVNAILHAASVLQGKGIPRRGSPVLELTPDSFYTGPFNGMYPAGTGDFEIQQL